jgi:hypothetical protein
VDVRLFCTHHTDLRSRKKRLLKRFAELGLAVEWIETYHPRDRGAWDHDGLSIESIGETSISLKHRDALRRQVSGSIERAVVLEDDVELPDDFAGALAGWLDEFHALGGDLLMIGTCCGIHAPDVVAGKSVYYGPDFRTRCAHAYAVTLEAARKILPELDHMPKGFDHDLNDIIRKHGLRVCYVEPGLEQLTQKGELLSAIEIRRTPRDRVRVLRRRLARRAARLSRRF